MKKKICRFLTIFICMASVFGVEYWGSGLSFSAGFSSGIGLKIPVEATGQIHQDFDKNSIHIGFSVNSFSKDVFAQAELFPWNPGICSFGVKYNFHTAFFNKIDGREIDNNCLGVFKLKTRKKNAFGFSLAVGAGLKNLEIQLRRSTLKLYNFYPVFDMQMTKRFCGRHEFFFGLASYDDYYYPLFLAPIFKLGYAVDVQPIVTLGCLLSVRYTDMFTLTAQTDGFQAKLFIRFGVDSI